MASETAAVVGPKFDNEEPEAFFPHKNAIMPNRGGLKISTEGAEGVQNGHRTSERTQR